jgi:hypothetical protein
VVFLNKHLYAGLAPGSKLRGGTRLRVPRPADPASGRKAVAAPPSVWHECRENETPREIAKRLGLAGGHAPLVALNAKRFPDLAAGSRLRKGTRLRLPRAPRAAAGSPGPGGNGNGNDHGSPGPGGVSSNGDGSGRDSGGQNEVAHVPDLEELYRDALAEWEEDPEVVAYRHWTFPDDENVEDTHASYMMAKQLVRRPRSAPPPALSRFEAAAAAAAQSAAKGAPTSPNGREKRGRDHDAAAAEAAGRGGGRGV